MRIEIKKVVWMAVLALNVLAMMQVRPAAEEAEATRKITKRVAPVYPPIAQKIHLTGVVKMLLTVTPEGSVKTVRTMGGNPILIASAEDAVKLWKFAATSKETTESISVKFDPQ